MKIEKRERGGFQTTGFTHEGKYYPFSSMDDDALFKIYVKWRMGTVTLGSVEDPDGSFGKVVESYDYPKGMK